MADYKIYGSKCWSMPYQWHPQSLSAIWKEIIDEHGKSALHKPIPGHTYRKRYHSLSEMDRAFFKKLPADIKVLTPPRLFRSTGWKYKGKVYLECELYWEFQYSYWYANEERTDWMAVRLLSYCYIPTTLTFESRRKPIQLDLFQNV